MTIKEAKKINEALDVAIELLEQEPINVVLDKIRAEIGATKEKWWYGKENDCFIKLSDVLQIINKYRKEQTDE